MADGSANRPIGRRAFLASAAVGATAIGARTALVRAAQGAPRPPNVVILMADDLGWGDVGYNGHPYSVTPHLDEWAATGVRFDRHYSAAPVCSPTRGSVLTGRHPFRFGVTWANVGMLPEGELTIGQVLQARGYRTGHFGKWHVGTITKPQATTYSPPWERGFDTCFSTERKVETYWSRPVPPGVYFTGEGTSSSGQLGDDSTIITDEAVSFMRSAIDARRPFLAVIWFHTPHLPLGAAQSWKDRIDGPNRTYYGAIAAMDDQIGRLRREIASFGVEDDTLLWFCSDNGPENSYGVTGGLRARKRSLFEGGVRVPGLFHYPRLSAGPQRLATPVSTVDILPTVMSLAGATIPESRARILDGQDLVPVLRGDRAVRDAPLQFWSSGQVAVVDADWKMVGSQLFDLASDPAETRSVARDHPDRVALLAGLNDAWRETITGSLAGDDYRPREPGPGDVEQVLRARLGLPHLPLDGGIADADGDGTAYQLNDALRVQSGN